MTTQKSAYERTRRLSGEVLAFQLEREAESLLAAAHSAASGRAARTLAKDGDLRVTLVAATAGTALDRHHVAGPITVQAFQGSLRVEAGDTAVSLPAGHLLALGPGVTHALRATEDSVFLVTLSLPGEPPDEVPVANV